MWIASQLGFFSIVFKDGSFHVRARVQEDLAALKAAARLKPRIESWPAADYRWRLRISSAELTRVFTALERAIDYGNFKSRIATLPAQQEKLDAYGQLWFALARIQSAHEHPPGQEHDHARSEGQACEGQATPLDI